MDRTDPLHTESIGNVQEWLFKMPDSFVLKLVLVVLTNAANLVAIWATGLARRRSRAIDAVLEPAQIDLWSERLTGKWWALRLIVWPIISALPLWIGTPVGGGFIFIITCSIAFRSIRYLKRMP
jgi:hypothetical protein